MRCPPFTRIFPRNQCSCMFAGKQRIACGKGTRKCCYRLPYCLACHPCIYAVKDKFIVHNAQLFSESSGFFERWFMRDSIAMRKI